MGINNSTNAALLAVRMLGAHIPDFQAKMAAYQETMKVEVEAKAAKLEDVGYKAYLEARK